MTHQYDWSKLDAGWSVNGDTLRYSTGEEALYESPVSKLEIMLELDYGRYHPDSPLAQLAKCRFDTNVQLVSDFLRQRDQAHDRQRKHEATHGWRNPPSIYEESET